MGESQSPPGPAPIGSEDKGAGPNESTAQSSGQVNGRAASPKQMPLRRKASVQFSRSVVSNSSRPHESQHARPPCPSPTPGVYPTPSSHLILCCPLLLPPIPPSIRVFSNESTLRMRWPKYWSFSFSISPSKEHPGLILLEEGLGADKAGLETRVFVQSFSHDLLFATP